MLQTVNKTEAGPAIAFDANEHAPERATMSFASAGPDGLWKFWRPGRKVVTAMLRR
jgi:hypothetical protein